MAIARLQRKHIVAFASERESKLQLAVYIVVHRAAGIRDGNARGPVYTKSALAKAIK